MSLFGENIEDDAVKFNNFRVSLQMSKNVQKIISPFAQVYGTAMLIFMSLIVFLGVQIVNKVSGYNFIFSDFFNDSISSCLYILLSISLSSLQVWLSFV